MCATQPEPVGKPYSADSESPTTRIRAPADAVLRRLGVVPWAALASAWALLPREDRFAWAGSQGAIETRLNRPATIRRRRSGMGKLDSINVQNVSKRVWDSSGELVILDDISLSVKAGESMAITGSSGSGKSTLLGLMAGLDTPSSGRIELLGHNLFALDEEQRAALRAKHVGFVFQSFQLLPNLTALENVMLPLELAGLPASGPAQAILERVGLGQRLRHYPRTLSGGEQQRVSLARAFVVEPDILFADEPTGSLDSANGEKVIELMFQLRAEHQTTLVLVTHDAQLAARCEGTVHLHAGQRVDGQVGRQPMQTAESVQAGR